MIGVTTTIAPGKLAGRAAPLVLGALLAVAVAGPSWYLAEVAGLPYTPWYAAMAGVAIGFVVRIAAAKATASARATTAFNVFVLVAVGVAALRAVYDVDAVYGAASSMANYQFNLRVRFSDTTRLISHIIGIVSAGVIGRSS